MTGFLMVCVGGAVGSGARYALATWIGTLLGTQFPYGTITVNVLGSFLIGVITSLSATTVWIAPNVRLLLTTGFLGGFTTYSTFNNETVLYVQQNLWGRALANVAVTVVVCLVAGFAGVAAARRVVIG